MKHETNNVVINMTVLELAKLYLDMKSKSYTVKDILVVARRILQWSEQKNRYCNKPKLKFIKDHFEIDEKYLK